MTNLRKLIAEKREARQRTQAELDATSLRNRVIKDDIAHLYSLHLLELAVQAQIAESDRLKRAAAKAVPRVHAALRAGWMAPWWMAVDGGCDWRKS